MICIADKLQTRAKMVWAESEILRLKANGVKCEIREKSNTITRMGIEYEIWRDEEHLPRVKAYAKKMGSIDFMRHSS